MKYKNLKIIYPIFVIGLMIITFSSCYQKDIQFGTEFADDQYTQVIQTDTITPLVSTVYIDSFVTSGSGTAIVGRTNDPAFGVLTSSAYFQLGAPTYSATSTEYQNATYDSLTVYIKLKHNIWYGDTTQPLTLNIYRLNENIIAPNGGTALYNTNSFTTESSPLASYSFTIQPNNLDSTDDTLSVRLPDAMGRDLFNRLQTGDYAIQSSDQFITFFNGLKISAASGSNLSLGISDSVAMRLYYKTPGAVEDVEKYAAFGLYNSSLQFNQISVQRAGALASANFDADNRDISSTATDSSAFLQPMANAVVKLTFPTLNNLLLHQGYIKIVKATLYVHPVTGTYEGIFGLPASLILSQTDLYNGFGSSLTLSGATQTGSLQYDVVNSTDQLGTYYTYDLTSYLQTLIATPSASVLSEGLLLSPATSSMFTSFNRMIMGDGKNSNAKLDLRIQYISVK
ncbi:hypothetical protein A9P82_10490 [Arachidicoccus ginsenosidimutans]|uniref:DUF4270 family protein n=1 Tax=Arachidicoccus sp. BS20 TaxID=1850526 RepID=UPI0007F125E3|nr:DUF4270 family protein [Arachidicoccus sp. BS20]ANI89678.1 hypothetical protein A9P82_10490 [Arachidicoccus sp. BS20]